MTDKNIVIFAPHPDDEVIGCYSLLNSGKVRAVVYFYEHDDRIRRAEANHCADVFDFTPIYLTAGLDGRDVLLPTDVLLLPNIKDSHEDHKCVNLLGKFCFPNNDKAYYSVDMDSKVPLAEAYRRGKEATLRSVYPSQSNYLNTHAECYLFESIVDNDMDTSITVKTSFEGIHCYPDAPEEVSYLRHPHRHLFQVRATLAVTHHEREVEFFMMKKRLDDFIAITIPALTNKSCESMAQAIINFLIVTYPGEYICESNSVQRGRDFYEVTVSEDGENESTVRFKIR